MSRGRPEARAPRRGRVPMSRSVAYTSSPLLASRTPVWRSKFIVAAIALGFLGLAGRAAWVQVFANSFFQKQGEVRFGRTLELPANRGRILDRNGLLLATSVPVPSIWAIPEDVERDRAKLAQLARLLEMPMADLDKKLGDEDKSFVWLKRQVDDGVAQQIAKLDIKGIYQRKEYQRKYPEGEAAAHVVGFTNVEDQGQEGMELAFDKELAGRPGSRHVIKDRLGRVVEDVGEQVAPVDGRDLQLSIDSKVQFFAYQKLREAVQENKAKAGSVVVLDAASGEVLALANYPSYSPDRRQNLTGEQLRNRALTDTFEPGSTMKPFTIGLALETGLVTPQTMIQTAPGYVVIGGMKISDSHAHGMLSVQQVIQKSSNIGTLKIALQMPPREMWEMFTEAGFGQKPHITFPGRRERAPAPLQDLEAGGAGHHVLWLRPVGVAVPDGPLLHRVRARRPDHSRHAAQDQRSRPWACGCSRPRPWPRSAPCCRWRRARAAPVPRRRRWAIRWAASPARRTSRSARATPPTSTVPGSWASRRSTSRASSSP